jgi:hypothetical protein
MNRHQIFFLALMFTGSVPVAAQSTDTDTGSMFSHNSRARIPEGKTLRGEKARPIIDEFGACIVNRFRMRALRAVSTLPESFAGARAISDVSVDECVEQGEMKMNEAVIRASLYRALYVADYRRIAPQVRPIIIDFTQGQVGLTGQAKMGVTLRQFADCVVRSNAAAVRTLVLAPSGTPSESAAMGAVGPYLGQCLTPGSRMEFTKSILFGLLSEVLYRDSVPGTKLADVVELPSAAVPAR